MSERQPHPEDADLAERLGSVGGLWMGLRAELSDRYALTERWVYGGAKYGWSCRMERGKNGLYLIPDDGLFRVGLALADASRHKALAGDLPPEIHAALAASTRAMEGCPVRVTVRTAADVAAVLRLADFKFSV